MQVNPEEVAQLQQRLEAGEELDLNKVDAATNAAAKAAMDSRFNVLVSPLNHRLCRMFVPYTQLATSPWLAAR